jgi:outer membrane biogenesis lipoprotein LolB
MPRRVSIVLAFALLLLTGCSTAAPFPGEWTKPGVEGAEQHHDEYECTREAALRHATAAERASAAAACMQARGYTRVAR